MSDMKLSLILDMVNKTVAPLKKFNNDIKRISKTLRRLANMKGLNDATQRVTNNLGNLTKKLKGVRKLSLITGGLFGVVLKTQLLDTAVEFENFLTILETTEGSSKKAQRSMEWISAFAANTPFELNKVTEAFVQLRAFGLDPTNGLLRTLGDTSSAMSKPILQAVEAIADAVTGENERLKEFGIKAQTKGNKTRFEFTDKEGKQQFKIVDKNNRAMIQSTLEAIWNEKYGGAMQRASRTWAGMMSNLSDQWTRFVNLIMKHGLFDFMKSKLTALLKRVDEMAANGKLQELAELVGTKLVAAFKGAWQAGSDLFTLFDQSAQFLGGYKNLFIALAAVLAAPLLISFVSLTAALVNFGTVALPLVITGAKLLWPALLGLAKGVIPTLLVAFKGLFAFLMANPIVLLITAIAGAAYLIIKNWKPIKAFFKDLFGFIGDVIKRFVDFHLGAFIKLGKMMRDVFSFGGDGKGVATRAQVRARDLAKNQTTDVSGFLKIQIDGEGRPKVKELVSNNSGIDFDVDTGLAMTLP